jgi:hypothetical protein
MTQHRQVANAPPLAVVNASALAQASAADQGNIGVRLKSNADPVRLSLEASYSKARPKARQGDMLIHGSGLLDFDGLVAQPSSPGMHRSS